MHRRPIALALVALAAPIFAGCGVGGRAEPPCAADGTATFGSAPALPVCGTAYDLQGAGGQPMASVVTYLPASGPYGSGQKRAVLSFALHGLGGLTQTAGISIDVDPGNYGFGGASVDASGDCTGAAMRPRLVLACELELQGGVRTPLALDLPPVPDPATDPGVEWLEVTYRFQGDYAAAATVRSAVTASADHTFNLVISLEDGALVVITARADDARQIASLRLPSGPGGGSLGEPWRPQAETPSLGPCTVTTDEMGRNGSLDCPGDADSSSGSATLEMTWRPLP